MKPSLAHIGATLLLTTAFISAAGAAAPDTQQGPTGSSDYFALKLKINDLGKFSRDIDTKVSTLTALGLTNDNPEVKDMQLRFKKDLNELAPKIVLTQSISEKDAATLAQNFATTLGTNAPDYIVKINGKTAFLHECQSELMTTQSTPTATLAKSIADCAVAKLEAAPAEETKPAVSAIIAPKKAETPKPVVEEAPAPAPAVVTAQVQSQTANASGTSSTGGGIKALITPVNLGIGGGVLGVLGLGALLVFGRKKKDVVPALEERAVTPPVSKPKIEL